jgi:hypothetical protein
LRAGSTRRGTGTRVCEVGLQYQARVSGDVEGLELQFKVTDDGVMQPLCPGAVLANVVRGPGGGALGVAIAATVAFTHTKTLLASGHAPPQAATSGFALGFWVLAGISAASVVTCIALVRGRELGQAATTSIGRAHVDERHARLEREDHRGVPS